MNLLLTSSGIKEIKKEFLSFFGKPTEEISATQIVTAAFGEQERPWWWVEEAESGLKEMGIKNIDEIDLRDKTNKELSAMLSGKDVIFVHGGNTFYLLKYIKESGFDVLLKDLFKKDILYVGVSAGSIVCSPTIESAGWEPEPDENKVKITDLSAMNLVPFFIAPHFKEEYRAKAGKDIKTTKYPVVALYDGQAVFVQNNTYKVIGPGTREFFNGFSET